MFIVLWIVRRVGLLSWNKSPASNTMSHFYVFFILMCVFVGKENEWVVIERWNKIAVLTLRE